MNPKKHSENKQFPPYVPFKAFRSFIERLHGTAIPPAIDPSLLRNMSGSGRSQLMSCLRFLNLTGPGGAVTDKFKDLVKSYKTEQWPKTLGQVVFDSYHTIVGDVDLDTGTDAQLDNAFRQRGGVDGQVLDKAKRFFLAAMAESGTKYSPFFGVRKPPIRRGLGIRQKAKKRHETQPWDEGGSTEDFENIRQKMQPFRIPLPDKGEAIIVFPLATDRGDWVKVRRTLDAYFGTDE